MGMSAGSSPGVINSEPNVVPMIDVLLVLLIIFMISQPLSRMGMDVQVPPKEQAHANDSPSNQIVLPSSNEPSAWRCPHDDATIDRLRFNPLPLPAPGGRRRAAPARG